MADTTAARAGNPVGRWFGDRKVGTTSTRGGVREGQRAAVELARMSGELTELVGRFRV